MARSPSQVKAVGLHPMTDGSNPSRATKGEIFKKGVNMQERSEFKNLFKSEVFNLKPEDFNKEEFLDIVAEEVWNLDEWTPEGIMMMKHMILRFVVPKELHEYDFNTFKKLLKKANSENS